MVGLTLFLVYQSSAATTDSTKVDTCKVKVEPFANVGVVSQYVWRGTMLDNKPNLQPILGLTIGNFEIGTVGSLSTLNNYYEADLYASYTFFNRLKFAVTDFYIDLSGAANSQSYFNYSDTAVSHHIVADAMWLCSKRFPVKLTASTILHSGWDLYNTGEKKFTSYFEARYYKESWELYVGALTGQSDFYLNNVDGFGIVNVGAAYNYKIKFNDQYSLPMVTQLCVNPQMEKFYLTFGVTF